MTERGIIEFIPVVLWITGKAVVLYTFVLLVRNTSFKRKNNV